MLEKSRRWDQTNLERLMLEGVKWEDLAAMDLPAIERRLSSPPYSLTGGAAAAVGRLVTGVRVLLPGMPLCTPVSFFQLTELTYSNAV